MACAIGYSMAALVDTERHVWFNLMGIKDKNKAFLLDATILPQYLFGDTVNIIVNKYQEAKCQLAMFRELIPSFSQEPGP